MAKTGNISIVGGTAPSGLIPQSQARATIGGLSRTILALTLGKLSVFIGLRSRRVIAFSGTPAGKDAEIHDMFAMGTTPSSFSEYFSTTLPGLQLLAGEVATTVKPYASPGVTQTASIAGDTIDANRQPFADNVLKPVMRSFSLQGVLDALDDSHESIIETNPYGWQGDDMQPIETLIFFGQDDNRISIGPVPAVDVDAFMDDIANKTPATLFGVGAPLELSTLLVDAKTTPSAPTASDEFFEAGGILI